jgi:ribose transport system substrate-binding protein
VRPSNLPKVAFVSNNPATFWTIVEAGCRKAETEAGVEVLFRKPDTGDASRQKALIDDLINQDIKAISVSVIDPKNQTAHLNEVAARVKLIAVDNDAPDSKRLAYIGTDNYAAGRAVGQLIKEALPDGGTIAIFVGQLEALNARQRRQGLLDELSGAAAPPDINVMPPATTEGGTYGKYKLFKTFLDQPEGESKAKRNASDAVTQLAGEPNVCLVGLWAYNPPAILNAVKDAKKLGTIKIIGFDEDFVTLAGIEDGHIAATVVQDPFNFGVEATKLMASLAKGETLSGNPIRYVPHRIVTKAGGPGRVAVAPFSAELRRNIGRSTR